MFRFNNWTPNTCNDLPECGQECHDLNICSDNSTYVDKSGITRYIFSTYDSDWNLTCMSGISCDQEVYDKPPKYNRHYAPCCWTVSVVGGSGIGTCGQSCEKNYSYIANPTFFVDVSEDNQSADVYIRHSFYGQGTGGCNTPNDIYPFYSAWGLIGTITDLNCGLPGSGLGFELGNFIQASSVPSLCNYDDMTVTYSGMYTREECVGNLFVSINTDLDWTSCLDVSTVIESGYPGCYTQDGEFISLGDPYNNSYQISMYEAISFSLDNFVVSGVTGYDDDIALASALKTTCNECQTINRTWELGQWDGRIPYNPKAICCNCPETDMCLNSWSLDLSQPSAIITLNSYAHGDTAKWLATFPDSGCIIDSSGGTWGFEYLWQAEPTSGDLPVNSGFWNRCDFTDSSIELNYTGNFTPTPSNRADCEEQIIDQPNGNCHICADRNGPSEFLVTVNLNFTKKPVYSGSTGSVGLQLSADLPRNSYSPKRYKAGASFACGTQPEIFELPATYQGDIWNGCGDIYAYLKIPNYSFLCLENGEWCDYGVPTPYYESLRDITSINECECNASVANGSWILEQSPGSCIDNITIRPQGGTCNCTPCSSGVRPINSCSWAIIPTNEGTFDPSIHWTNGARSGVCPCAFSLDAGGNLPAYANQCKGCTNLEYESWDNAPVDFGTCPPTRTYTVEYSECGCFYSGPRVTLGLVLVSGIPKLQLSVSVPGLATTECSASDSVLLDVPFSGYDCNGDPFFNGQVDCSQPINHTFTIPNTSTTYIDTTPGPNSGTVYYTNCHTGGTITVESL